MQNHFELFGLSPRFALEKDRLETSYRDIQSQVHPDRHAAGGDAARRAALAQATRVNDAYRILRDPVLRAKHLLELQGVDVAFETNTQMPTDFLLQQLEWREELEGAVQRRDAAALDRIRAGLAAQSRDLEQQIGDAVDARGDYAAAAGLVRKLMFLRRLDEEAGAAYEDLE